MFDTPQNNEEQQRRSRIDTMMRTRVYDRDFEKSPEKTMQHAVERRFPQISYQETQSIAREVILSPRDEILDFGSEKITVSDLSYELAKGVDDLSYRNAFTIENVNSETSSSEEYYRWIDEGHKVIHDMNDGFVSEKDMEAKEHLVGNLNQREADLMLCLGLYESSRHPDAPVKYKELLNKLTKLREIRSAVQNTTKNQIDVEKEPETTSEQKRKAEYYLAALAVLDRLTPEDKTKLNINHDHDFLGYSFGEKMKFDYQHKVRESYAESLVAKRQAEYTTTKDQLRAKLEMLSGRKTEQKAPYKDVDEESRKKFLENIRNKKFDGMRFVRLNEQNER